MSTSTLLRLVLQARRAKSEKSILSVSRGGLRPGRTGPEEAGRTLGKGAPQLGQNLALTESLT